MKAPQIIYIVLLGIALLLSANKHGQLKKGTWSFWTELVSTFLHLGLLYWGGFFG